VLLLPAIAHADRMRVASYDMDDGGGTVRLESDAPMGEPWLRIEGRTIKIWFPHVQEVARFDHERGGAEPIHALALRSGASETALLKVELGQSHAIAREDIAITRDGLHAAVKLRVPTAQPVATQPAAAAPAPAVVVPVVQAAAPAPAPPAPAPVQPKATETVASAATNAPTTGLGMAAAANADDEEELGAQDEDSERANPIWLLGAASVLLAFVYFGLQHVQRTRSVHSPAIEIVGSRKLGPRQELMIVRALGADHLLLCTNGRAERVASTPTNTAPPAPPPTQSQPPAASEQKSSQAGGIGLISRLSSQHRLRKLLDSVGDTAPATDAEADDAEPEPEHEFSAELRTAKRQRSALLHSLPAPAARQSESVAGITKLRQRR
jgi:flagellar biogenesis protein FliO